MSEAFCKYLTHDGVELFTVVCLPDKNGKFPTVIYRTPYVDESESKSSEEICEKNLRSGRLLPMQGTQLYFSTAEVRVKAPEISFPT